jgi:hypothetical protein
MILDDLFTKTDMVVSIFCGAKIIKKGEGLD